MTEQAHGFDPEGFHAPAATQKAFLKQYVPDDDDEGVLASFERVQEHKPFLSQQKGEDVYQDVDFIRIVIRGNDKLEIHRPANDADKRRFPFAWQQYRLGKEQSAKGTPLDEIGIHGTMIPAYHAKNVFTAEDLAKVTDGNLQSLPAGARDARHKARERVQLKQKAEGTDANVAPILAQNAALMKQNEEQGAQLREALAAISKLQKQPANPDEPETPRKQSKKSG